MNQIWQNFIGAQTHVDGDIVANFGDAQKELTAISASITLNELSSYGLIEIKGDDAEAFLQGQFSNDITHVTADLSQISSYSSPKGRMFAIFRLCRYNDSYLLCLPRSILASVLKRLSMYVMMSKVTLTDVSDDLPHMGLTGEGSGELLESITGIRLDSANAAAQHEQILAIRHPGDTERYQIIAPPTALIELWSAAAKTATLTGSDAWPLLDIQAGIPSIHPETSEAFVAQMTNLQTINGVNFKKGCYPGQEIVARMHYLGKLKRQMYLAEITTSTRPLPGTTLVAANEKSGQGTGQVVDARPNKSGGFDLLAVLNIASAEASDICVETTEGPKLQFKDLPYVLGAKP